MSIFISAATWAVIIAASVAVAATIPYLATFAVGGSRRPRQPVKSGRTLIIAAVAVIILMVGTVTGLAYGVGPASPKGHHNHGY